MADHRIALTHLNIRQSIAILLIKLVLTDIILAFVVIGFYFILVQGGQLTQPASQSTVVFLIAFGITGVFKIFLTIYIVLQWLTEYYEITPDAIMHKSGIIAKKTQRYDLGKIRAMSLQDSFIGELCNFATITLYDIRLNKYLDMYLIHNPDRYAKVLKVLRPDLEVKTDRIVLPGMPKRDLIEETDN